MSDEKFDMEQLRPAAGESGEQPEIRFGETWIPAHEAWKKMETAAAVADAIAHFNENFPHLSSPLTRSVVPDVRQRLKNVQLRMPSERKAVDYAAIATEWLGDMGPEDVVERLEQEHNQSMDLRGLIQLVGDKPYLNSLQREAQEFSDNKILPDQAAQIWNEMSRPAPGGGLWSGQKIDMLLSGKLLEHA